jgi:hypothetical protein
MGPHGNLHPLAILRDLNDVEKHRLIPLCRSVVFQGQNDVLPRTPYNIVELNSAKFLKSGEHMITLGFPEGIDATDVNVTFTLSADITFGEETGLYGHPLFPTLMAIRCYLYENVFVEPLIDGFDWTFKPTIAMRSLSAG